MLKGIVILCLAGRFSPIRPLAAWRDRALVAQARRLFGEEISWKDLLPISIKRETPEPASWPSQAEPCQPERPHQGAAPRSAAPGATDHGTPEI